MFAPRLGGILAVALVLRVAVVLLGPELELIGDAGDYHRHALSIAAGMGYPDTAIAAPGTPTALRPPAYPFWLGGIYAVTGDSIDAVRLLGALLGALTVLLVGLIARRIWGERVALIAAGLAAVAPALVYVNGSLISEQLFLPLMLGAVLVTLRARDAAERVPPGLAAAAGALCGLAALTRVVGLVLVAAIAVGLWRRRGWRAPAVAVLATLVVISPWVVRNNLEFERFVPLATQEGFNLFGTYNAVSAADGEHPANWNFPLDVPEARELFARPGYDEARISSELGARARAYALDHPGYALRVAYWNTLRTLGLAEQPLNEIDLRQMGVPDGSRVLLEVSAAVMFAGALLGALVLLTGRAARAPAFVWLCPLLLFVPVALFLAVARYRLPLDPFLLMLCAVAIATVFAGRGRDARPAGAGPPPAAP